MNFLAAIKSAFFKAFTTENICGSFRGAGLVSFDPEAVVLQLDLRLRMPTPSTPDTILEPQTPIQTTVSILIDSRADPTASKFLANLYC